MNKIKSEKKLCLICMEEHEVYTVEEIEEGTFKDEKVSYKATYEYCPHADEYLETEDMIKANNLAMKDAYRRKAGLLTSDEIAKIREKYGVSQKDFSEILGWGMATITRYENHQVQDRAHDDVLRKINNDPKWFLEMLQRAKNRIPEKAFNKYLHIANEHFKKNRNQYLIDSIHAIYADIEDEILTGKTKLNLNKVVEMINYFASKVSNLHKVKLVKMLWFSDFLHYKRHGKSISGLAYRALPMGAVPQGCDQIMALEGVTFDVINYGEYIGYKFRPTPGFEIKELSEREIETLDTIISELGHMNKDEIVERMHSEVAYSETEPYEMISYVFAEMLSIE